MLSGIAYFELRKSDQAQYTVTAGAVSFAPEENSLVRVSVAEGPATFAVIAGSAKLQGQFTAVVRAGESLHADAKDPARYFLTDRINLESWDAWNSERDRAATNEGEARTAARDQLAGVQGYGWADLDANGTWYDVDGEGQVWQPAAADEQFDPYGYGNWVWQNSSYVWASGYRWGWVPFRCGRWEYVPVLGWVWQGDSGCARWGSRGAGLLIGRRRPPHYREPPIPTRPPGKFHPLVALRDKDGPRPALLAGGVRQAGGTIWKPLPRLGIASAGGLALDRDFPIDAETHHAVGGVIAGSVSSPSPEPVRPVPVHVGRAGTPSGETLAPRLEPPGPTHTPSPARVPPAPPPPARAPIAIQPRPAPATPAAPAPARPDPAKPKA